MKRIYRQCLVGAILSAAPVLAMAREVVPTINTIRGTSPDDALNRALARYGNMRVTNGTVVPQGGGSAFVKLMVDLGSSYGLCGGTLIDPTLVVTASHCLYDRKTRGYKSPSDVYVYYGDVAGNRNYVQPTQVIHHPDYNTGTLRNDITLLRIPKLNLKKGVVETISLYNDSIQPKTPMRIYGWGLTSTHGSSASPTLLTQTVYISYPNDCRVIESLYNSANGPQICANNNYNVGVDVCSGDSGTGTIIYGSNGVPYLAGLVSYGTDANGGLTCGEPGSFGMYTNVYYYRDWIESSSGIKLSVGPVGDSQTATPTTTVTPPVPTATTSKPSCYFLFFCF